jgi:hypothetical protein
MRFLGVCVLLLLNAAPLLAASSGTSKAARAANERLSAWLTADRGVQAKLARAKAPSFVEPDLRDAVADAPVPSEPAERRPILRIGRTSSCRNLRDCAVPPLAMDVPAGAPVEPAVLAMMRPWIWLAEAKGARLGVAHTGQTSQALLAMNLEELGLSGVGLNIAPRPGGGVHLWFDRESEVAMVYFLERGDMRQR